MRHTAGFQNVQAPVPLAADFDIAEQNPRID